mmetsp:Transcript_6331/g.25729  ORF Transcript_6331/g.25729 Transcript_6331/m.25729 type:complete len:246 (+) Transcript_6331:202-939(+)
MVFRISATVPAYCTGAPFISTSVADSIRPHSPPFTSGPMPAPPTAATSAACSGDIVGLYAADSAERPACISPLSSTSAKPAGDALYGAYAAFASVSASSAADASSSSELLAPNPPGTNRKPLCLSSSISGRDSSCVRSRGPNECGSRSHNGNTRCLLRAFVPVSPGSGMMTRIDAAPRNSFMNCRQCPHGAAVVAIALSARSPARIAVTTANCSACMLAFKGSPGSSTFTPRYTAPEAPRAAAPT